MLLKIVSIFIGSGFGGILRFLISISAKKFLAAPIFGTLFANIIGCFLIGLVFGLTVNKGDFLPQTLTLFITAGFLGGLTTFSTLNLEVFELIKEGKVLYGALYMILSCILGLLFTYLGYSLAK